MKKNGFTLIELLVVVAIIGILAAVGVVAYNGYTASAKINAIKSIYTKVHMKLYVGNLPWSIGNQELEDLFSSFGTVTSANVITDRDTKRSRGFGFVELDSGGPEAIEAMNESEVEGRKVIVNEARPKT